MHTALLLCLVAPALLLALAACEGGGEEGPAWAVDVLSSRLSSAQIEVMESAPPQFAVTVQIAMPNPGYEVGEAAVSGPDDLGRITARVTTRQREGMWPQVISPMSVRVALGTLDAGEYVLEVFEERAGRGTVPVGTLLLRARGR